MYDRHINAFIQECHQNIFSSGARQLSLSMMMMTMINNNFPGNISSRHLGGLFTISWLMIELWLANKVFDIWYITQTCKVVVLSFRFKMGQSHLPFRAKVFLLHAMVGGVAFGNGYKAKTYFK